MVMCIKRICTIFYLTQYDFVGFGSLNVFDRKSSIIGGDTINKHGVTIFVSNTFSELQSVQLDQI